MNENFLLLVPIAVIGALSFFLTFHRGYQDGIVGRAALFITFIVALLICLSVLRGHKVYYVPGEALVLGWAIMFFYLRFVARFVWWWLTGKGGWQTRREIPRQRGYDDADTALDRVRNDEDRSTGRERSDADRTVSREKADADLKQRRAASDTESCAKRGIH